MCSPKIVVSCTITSTKVGCNKMLLPFCMRWKAQLNSKRDSQREKIASKCNLRQFEAILYPKRELFGNLLRSSIWIENYLSRWTNRAGFAQCGFSPPTLAQIFKFFVNNSCERASKRERDRKTDRKSKHMNGADQLHVRKQLWFYTKRIELNQIL